MICLGGAVHKTPDETPFEPENGSWVVDGVCAVHEWDVRDCTNT